MSTSVQMGAATLGTAGALAAGGLGFSQLISSEKSIAYQPTCITFDPEVNLKPPYSNSLLSLTREENLYYIAQPTVDNKLFWEWALNTKYKPKLTTEKHALFENLTIGFDENEENSKALNQACNAAYKAEKSEYKINESFLLQNIGDFCTKGFESFDISEPKSRFYTSNEATQIDEYQHGLLGVPKNKSKLVKKEGTNFNNLWWEWAYKNLLEEYENKSGSHFEHVTKGYSDTPAEQGQNETSLNQACDSAYKKDKVELEKSEFKLLQEVAMFCSSIKEEVILSAPVEPYFALLNTSSTASNYNTGLANENGNKERLLDPENTKNQGWFEWSYQVNISEETNKTQNLPEMFQKVNKGWDPSPGKTTGSQTALNQACKEAYSKAKGDLAQKTNEKTLFKFIRELCAPKKMKGKLEAPKK